MFRAAMTICIAAGLLLAGVPEALADDVAGPLSGEITWAAKDSPFHVSGELIAEVGSVWTIEPGVTVVLGEGASIEVNGEIIARGTADDRIVFTGAMVDGKPARWGSLKVGNSSVDATFSNLDDYQSGSILEHCVFEHASKGVVLDWASPYIADCKFSHNRTPFSVDIEGGAAIYLMPGSAPRIRDCVFHDNLADGFGNGGAIYVDEAQPILQDNTFLDNTSMYGGAVCTLLMASPIVGNNFEGNAATGSEYSKGGAVSLVSSVSAVLNNTVKGNQSVLDGGGIHVCVDCFPHATPFFFDNTITGNSAETGKPEKGAGGLGAGYIRTVADNNIHDNTRGGEPSEFGWYHPLEEGMPDWIAHRSIANNWWGTADAAQVADLVTDGTDIEGVGTVSVEPLRQSPVTEATPRVTLTTRRLHYDEPGEPMPVYLTVYNPGASQDFELRLLLTYDNGAAVPYAAPLDLPHEEVAAGAHTFTMPENSVLFRIPISPKYDPGSGMEGGWWRAALYAADTGELVGQVSEIRFDLIEEDAQ